MKQQFGIFVTPSSACSKSFLNQAIPIPLRGSLGTPAFFENCKWPHVHLAMTQHQPQLCQKGLGKASVATTALKAATSASSRGDSSLFSVQWIWVWQFPFPINTTLFIFSTSLVKLPMDRLAGSKVSHCSWWKHKVYWNVWWVRMAEGKVIFHSASLGRLIDGWRLPSHLLYYPGA